MAYPSNSTDATAQDQIKAFVERVERLNEERKAIADDIKEIYAEARGNGFNIKALKIIIREREQDPAELLEREALLDLYRSALGIGTAIATPARAREANESQSESNDGKPVGLSPMEDGETDGVASRLSEGSGSLAPIRQMSMTPLEPREAGGLKGFGFTVKFDDAAERPTAADNARALRPWCLHADDLSKCAGQGRKHCFACQKARADSAGEAA